jgi:hypothetical protein
MFNVGDIVKYNDYEIILYGTIIEVIPKKNKYSYRVMWFNDPLEKAIGHFDKHSLIKVST